MTEQVVSRRRFLAAAAAGAATTLAARAGLAQEGASEARSPSQRTGAPITAPETPGATMSGEGYRPVRLAPKPGAAPSMTNRERDEVERQLSCPCPCTLDVFTCRTSMPCEFSPAMHADVAALVRGGYSADEIIAAFERTYGERVLMSPKKEGFNWAGYLAPFAAVGAGGVVIAALLKRWQRPAPVAASAAAPRLPVSATSDELARLDAAVRRDDR
jgi:cytochrome c-type biogenesis protein CcmH